MHSGCAVSERIAPVCVAGPIIASVVKSRWSPTTKRAVVVGLAAVSLLLIWRAGDIVQPFLWAAIISYILLPLVGAIERRSNVPRTLAAVLVFLAVLATIFGGVRF